MVKDITISVAAAVTAFVAYKGVESWRSELGGRASFEAARRLMFCSYKLRDELSYCRSPFIPAGEFPEGYDSINTTPRKEGDAYAFIYKKRFETVRVAVMELDAAALETEALWGTEVRGAVQELRACAQTLNANIMAFVRSKYDGPEAARDRNFEAQMFAVLNEMNAEKDAFSQRVSQAIEGIEHHVRPHLART